MYITCLSSPMSSKWLVTSLQVHSISRIDQYPPPLPFPLPLSPLPPPFSLPFPPLPWMSHFLILPQLADCSYFFLIDRGCFHAVHKRFSSSAHGRITPLPEARGYQMKSLSFRYGASPLYELLVRNDLRPLPTEKNIRDVSIALGSSL